MRLLWLKRSSRQSPLCKSDLITTRRTTGLNTSRWLTGSSIKETKPQTKASTRSAKSSLFHSKKFLFSFAKVASWPQTRSSLLSRKRRCQKSRILQRPRQSSTSSLFQTSVLRSSLKPFKQGAQSRSGSMTTQASKSISSISRHALSMHTLTSTM